MRAVRLQEFLPGGGSDLEVETERVHLTFVQPERGWRLPSRDQLEQYARVCGGSLTSAIVVMSEMRSTAKGYDWSFCGPRQLRAGVFRRAFGNIAIENDQRALPRPRFRCLLRDRRQQLALP